MKTKICSNPNCPHNGEPQPISNFSKNKSLKSGYEYRCKDCRNKYKRKLYMKYKEKNKLRNKKWAKENHEKVLEMQRNWREKNLEKQLELNKKWFYNSLKFKSVYRSKLQKYEEVRQDPDNPDLLQVRCFNSNCKKWFNPTNLQSACRLNAINGKMVGENHFYCSQLCKDKCPVYNSKYKEIDKKCSRSDIQQSELREIVLEEDNYTCQMCGKSQEDFPDLILHCHHVIPISQEMIFSSDVDNCLTLCQECHQKVHKLPGCQLHELQKKAKEQRNKLKNIITK